MTGRFAGTCLVVLVAACGDGGTNPTPTPTPTSLSGLNTTFTMTAGDSVIVTITVNDQNGAAMPSATVTITSSDPTKVSIATRPSGFRVLAEGPVGSATLTASSGSLSRQATVTVGPAAPSSVVVQGSDTRSGFGGLPFSDSLKVVVSDRFANPTPGVAVQWSVTAGGGSLSPATATTNAAGIVAAAWTAGCTIGAPNAVEAAVTGVAAPASFTGSVTQLAPSALVVHAGSGQSDTIQSRLPDTLAVMVTAAGCGGPLPGALVTWATTGGRGSLAPVRLMTDAAGLAYARWTVGGVAGVDTATATVAGLAISADFLATVRAGDPTALDVVGGQLQIDTIGATLGAPLTVKLADRLGNGVPNRAVQWTSNGGRGSLAGGGTTDVSGRAGARWTLGTVVGKDTAVASAGIGLERTFTATVRAGAVHSLAADSGDAQTGAAGRKLTKHLVARARDRVGNRVPGAVLAWSVSAGGGSLSRVADTTDAFGRSHGVEWTLGRVAGVTNTAQAVAQGPGVARSFTANAVAGPVYSVSLDSAFVIIDVGSARSMPAAVADTFGNAISAPSVTWTSRAIPVAGVSTAGMVDCATRGQAVVVAQSGAGADSALVVCAVPGGPVVYADVPFGMRAASTATWTVYVDMRTSGELLGSTALDITWDPSVLEYQGYANADASPTVNDGNAAAGRVRLSLADPGGYPGLVGILSMTFRAVGTPGASGPLSLTTTELAAASSFTNLLADLVWVTHPVGVQ